MGSTLFLLDQDHEIRKTYRYDAFGNLLKETGDIPNRLTYTGQIYDGAAIQYYLRARFYNPAIGRFMQEDTYRGDGLNLYAYCANNPVIYYDPSGHILLSPIRATEPANDERVYSGDLMSPDEAARYSEYWRKLGIGSDETWNEYLKYNPDGTIDDYFNIIKNESPWPSGYNPVEVTLYPGDTFEMALGVGQSPTTPGRFATPTGSITDFDYVRNDLAVKEAWKPDVDRVVVYQVKDDVMLLTLQGPVGSQIDLGNNTYLRGGAEQINILLDRSIDAMDYLNILSINSIYK
ncbi:MAG: RHS repeat-associated core domain-containing protein [Lachnospiraceae bacterium]|nr:RHS repeat-associated core domain-containing protein [Lachnospiraceae bacterium]